MQQSSASPRAAKRQAMRRSPSNRLKTNLLYLAALFLFALMPSVGWAQTRETVSTAQQLRAALENSADLEIVINAPTIILNNGHETGINHQPYNCQYLVVGKKTIKGNNNTIKRGNYINNSIVLTAGAELVIEDLTLDGDYKENYASMVVVPDTVATWEPGGVISKRAVNGRLEMKRCTIQKCRLKTISPQEFKAFEDAQIAHLNTLVGTTDTYSFSAYHNSGGAGVNFQPAITASGTANNTIILDRCIFLNNEITPSQYDFDRQIGGALALMGGYARGGTIKDCTFQNNKAPNSGGAIVFYRTLIDDRVFNFTGTNKIGGSSGDGNSSGKDGGGILIEGGKVIIDGQADISYNTAGNMGGGISLRGGWLYFKSSNNGDHVRIHGNKAGHITNNGSGGGIFVAPLSQNDYMELSNDQNVKLTISNDTCVGSSMANGFGGGIYIGGGGDNQDIWNAQKHKVTLVSASTNPNDNKRILITDNEATFVGDVNSRGGGISVRQNVVATFTKCIIKGNKAKGYGGGISLYKSNAIFEGCLIEYNHAWGEIGNKMAHGGGVSIENDGDNKFIGDTIRYNGYVTDGSTQTTKTHNGGGVSITSSGKVVFGGTKSTDQCHIYQNKTIDGGGGLYMDSDFGKLIGNCHVEDNTAKNGGGIYYMNGGFENTNYVYSNIADTCGGGVYVDIGNQKELKGLVIGSNVVAANEDKGNRAQLGGGIYAKVGTNLTLTINDCKIVHNKWQSHDANNHIDIIKGGGLYMSESSNNYTVDLKGGTIIEYNEAGHGGGVYVSDDNSSNYNLILQLTNASLSYNKATTGHGGGIYNDKKTVQSNNATDVTLNGNKALEGNGGGIYNDGTCTLNNCRIGQSDNNGIDNSNEALYGGGIYNNTNDATNLGGNTTFENNKATNDGGGLYNDGTTTFIAGGNINFTGNKAGNNTSSGSGGGLYNNWLVTQAKACTLAFVNNTASNNGGGVYHTRGRVVGGTTDLTLYGATFKGNHAVENGGGIYTNHTCILDSCHIGQSGDGNGNRALNGGGIYKGEKEILEGGMLTISGGEVSNNTASNNGGGIYLEEDDTYVNDSCLIQWNEATNGDGGGIYLNGQHGFEKGQYVFYSCAILKHDGITEGPTIEIDLRKLRVVSGTSVTLFAYGSVISGSYLDIQNDGIISNLGIYYEIEETPEINAWTNNNNGDYFLLRLKKQYSNNVFAEVKVKVYYNEGGLILPPNYNYSGNDVQVENYDVVAISSTITLNGCTVGGETNKGNVALAGDGGGIYISPNATAIMTSDGSNGECDESIANLVTYNTAKNQAGGVYKDGTLKVEGHVIVNDNKAGQPWPDEPYTQGTVFLNNVHIPAESDDDQQILIIGDLVCGSKIGVTKTKFWGKNVTPDYGKQGEHTYETDDNFLAVRTPIARVDSWSNATPPALQTQVWALDAYKRNVYFDDTDSYAVWSMNYANADGNTHNVTTNYGKAYSIQNDYFIETWRSYAKNVEGTDVVTETVTETEGGVSQEVNYVTQIKTAPGLAYFAKQVNGGITHLSYSEGNTYAGKNVALTTNIYLEDHYWEPIGFTREGEVDDEGVTGCGRFERGFSGTYDGRGHFVLNPISILPVFDMGFFGLVVGGRVERTFVLNNNFTATNDGVRCLGGIAGRLSMKSDENGGTFIPAVIDGCEATSTLKRYETPDQSTDQPTHTGGIAGYVTANDTVRNSFAVESTLYGTANGAVGGLVGTNAGLVANSYTKKNTIYASTCGALVGNNTGTLTNAYSDTITGALVGTGTAGTRVYAASSDVYQVGNSEDKAQAYTPVINADHLGYMWYDNIISGKNIPLFDTLNSRVADSNGYAYWARPALSYYTGQNDGRFTGSEQPINDDLPVLRLWESKSTTLENKAYQGGFRSVGNVKIKEREDADAPTLLSGNVLQYAGPDRDGAGNTILNCNNDTVVNASSEFNAELDGAIVRADVDVCFFIYGDITQAPQETVGAKKISVYEDVAILNPGTLGNYEQTYVGVTFDNSKRALSTLNVNELQPQPLSRNWHLFSTPLWEAPLGFNYKGHNTNTYGSATDNYSNTNHYNNPWDGGTSAQPNQHGGIEFSWLNNGAAGHNRYWMKGWGNAQQSWINNSSWSTTGDPTTSNPLIDRGTAYPYATSTSSSGDKWEDGYWPSKVNLTAVSRDDLDLTFVNPTTTGTANYWSDENPEAGIHRYPYGMDFYSYNEPKYHYINFKRNGPNHWHTDAPHLHLNYTPEKGSNNPVSGGSAYPTNVNEEKLITGKGYIATIGAKTLLQSSGKLGGVDNNMNREIQITRNENPLHISEGWNLVGNPYHAYLNFDRLVSDTNAVGRHNASLLSTTLNDGVLPQGTTNLPFYVIYDASSYNTGNPESALKYYVKGGSSGGDYANRYLHPHQGFYVLVKKGSTENGNNGNISDTLKFTTAMTVPRADFPNGDGTFRDMGYTPAYPLVNLYLTSDEGCADVCVVEFNRPEGWTGATKMRELRQGNGLLYAMHDDHNYAVAFVPQDATRVPIKFESKSEEGDTYTLSWETANGDFLKLILVDNITGVQYDMLRNSSYSFHGKKEDYWSRFYITFEVTGIDEEIDDEDDASTSSSTFAFYDGEQWVVTGSGTLDLIDLQGRILHHTTLGTDGQTRIGLPDVAKGMYLLRMNNNHMTKVQKIIVK